MRSCLILPLLLAACLPLAAQSDQPFRKLGAYTIEPEKLNPGCAIDKHGGFGQLTHRILYKDRVVTETALFAFVSPYNPLRIMYSVSPSCGGDESEVGTFYFEPSRQQPVKVRILDTDAPQGELDAMWSADDKFALLCSPSQDFELVNLATGASTNLSRRLYIEGSVMTDFLFRGWSPDGKRLALVLSSTVNRADGRLSTESHLVSFDPAALAATYVASMRKREGWSAGEFAWVKDEGRSALTVEPALQDSAAIYVRPGGLKFHPLPDLH